MERNSGKKQIINDDKTSSTSPFLNRVSIASRLQSGNTEVKGISRKEFKPTIPIRRKKHSAQIKTDCDTNKLGSSDNSDFKQKLKVRFEEKSGDSKPGGQKKDRRRKELVRASTGLFGGAEQKLDDDPFSSARTAAELEEETYVDPFHQSTNELTPVTLPINPRIDSKSKLLVGKDTGISEENQETNVAELLYRPPDDNTESTYVFNLPDVLPIDMSKLSVSDESKAATTEPTEPDPRPSIHSLPEGYLGRLQILKSGKARLVIGEVPFDVSLNSKSGFLQEILCCQTQALDRGIIANLGTAPYSLSVSPEFDELIK